VPICFFLNARVSKLIIAPHAGEFGSTGVSLIKSLNDQRLNHPVPVQQSMTGSIAGRSHIMATMMMITIIILTRKPEEERGVEAPWDFLVNSSIEPIRLFQNSLRQALMLSWAPVE
jgi:hypothetical protein